MWEDVFPHLLMWNTHWSAERAAWIVLGEETHSEMAPRTHGRCYSTCSPPCLPCVWKQWQKRRAPLSGAWSAQQTFWATGVFLMTDSPYKSQYKKMQQNKCKCFFWWMSKMKISLYSMLLCGHSDLYPSWYIYMMILVESSACVLPLKFVICSGSRPEISSSHTVYVWQRFQWANYGFYCVLWQQSSCHLTIAFYGILWQQHGCQWGLRYICLAFWQGLYQCQ